MCYTMHERKKLPENRAVYAATTDVIVVRAARGELCNVMREDRQSQPSRYQTPALRDGYSLVVVLFKFYHQTHTPIHN